MWINIVTNNWKKYAYDNNNIKEIIKNNRMKLKMFQLIGKYRLPRDFSEKEFFTKQDLNYIKETNRVSDYLSICAERMKKNNIL